MLFSGAWRCRRVASPGFAEDLVELVEPLDGGVQERDGVDVHPPAPRRADVREIGRDHTRRPGRCILRGADPPRALELVDPGSGLRDPRRPRERVDQPRPRLPRRESLPHPPVLSPDVGQMRLGLHQPRIEASLQQVLPHRLGATGREVANGLRASGKRSAKGHLGIPAGHEPSERVAEEVLDDEHRHRGDHRRYRRLEHGQPLDHRMHRGLVNARQHGCERPVMDHEPDAPPFQEGFDGEARSRSASSRFGGDRVPLGVGRQSVKQLGASPAGEGMMDVTGEGVQQRAGQVAGQRTRVKGAIALLDRVTSGRSQRGQQRNPPALEARGLRRRQVAHLDVVTQHGPVQAGHPAGERPNVLVLGGVAQQRRETRIPVVRNCRRRVASEPCRVPDCLLEVVAPLGSDRFHDGPEAAAGVRQGDPAGPFDFLAERAAPPDVLRQRPDVVDVLEALSHRLVAEPLSHGLRRVPAMNEASAGQAEATVPDGWKGHHGDDCSPRQGQGSV